MPGVGIVGTDYYAVLHLTRNASDADIKKAYRKLALEARRNSTPAAQTDFELVCEAYDVLSSPERKGFYDLFGEAALKHGMPDGAGGAKGGFYAFNGAAAADMVFKRFFGTSNPYEALEGISASFEQMTAERKLAPGKKKTYDVTLSLEDIYHGCLKRVTHVRRVLHADGSSEAQERQLTIDVRPGLPDGTQFVFQAEGNVVPGMEPGPVVFVLRSQAHPHLARRGPDLLHQATIPLYQALAGTTLAVQMLDGRQLNVPVTDIVTPGHSMTVPNEGFPKPGGGRGNLVVTFDVLFPRALSEHQRVMLKAAFFLPHKLDAQQAKAVRAFEAAFRIGAHGWEQGFEKEHVPHTASTL